jgi:PAS domain S-box-containing protein
VNAQGRVLADMRGKPERMIGVNMDITQRKEAEENLRRSEARYRSLIEASTQVVWTCAPDGKQDRELPEWQAFTGQTGEQIRGLGWMDAIHPEDVPATMAAFADAIRSKSVFNLEQRLRRHDGAYRYMQVRGVPILDTSGEIAEWIGTHTDVTEQKLSQQALVRAEKLSAAGRLAATVAHEINNPLAAVTNIHFLLAHDKSLPENAREILALADRELKRVTHMVRQTLSFYKEHTYHEQISVSALIQEVIQLYGGRVEARGARIRTELDDSLMLRTLPGELRQILSNLIANSLDALADEGTLWIRARLRRHGESSVAQITVADTGAGIPAAIAAHIFEPFYTTKEDIGTGLGLWVTKQLVDKHHGRIAMRSRVGHGTVFILQFPIETAALAKAS